MYRFHSAGRRLRGRQAFACSRRCADRRICGGLFSHWRGRHLRLRRGAQLWCRGGLHGGRPGWGQPPDDGRADRCCSHPGYARHYRHRHWGRHRHGRRHGTHLGHAPRHGRSTRHLLRNRERWHVRIEWHAPRCRHGRHRSRRHRYRIDRGKLRQTPKSLTRHTRHGRRDRRCRPHLRQAPWRGHGAKTRGQAIHSRHGSRCQRGRAIGNHPGQRSRHAEGEISRHDG